MKPSKGFHCTIFEITKEELDALKKRFENNQFTECDKQLYVYYDDLVDKWIAIDNTAGYLYIEEFTKLKDAYIWLLDLKVSEVLQQAEEQNWWW